jgi:universal stress protein A
VDLGDESEQVMAHAKRVADSCAASLAVCHVVGLLAMDEAAQSLQQAKLIDLAAGYAVQRDAVHVLHGRPASAIHALADQLEADLIVVGTHGKHGAELMTGSTANAVLHGARCDALSVRIAPSVH